MYTLSWKGCGGTILYRIKNGSPTKLKYMSLNPQSCNSAEGEFDSIREEKGEDAEAERLAEGRAAGVGA